MSKIKVLPTAFSGEEIIEQALAAADAGLPAGVSPQGATVIRDASGKVVSVEVNLPEDVSQADLTNARNKINENPGVSKAQGFPLMYTEDCENGTDGQKLNAYELGNLGNLLVSTVSPISGTKSLKRASSLQQTHSYTWSPSAFGLSAIHSMEQSVKVKFGTGHNTNIQITLVGSSANFFVSGTGSMIAMFAGAPVGSSIAIDANTTYELKAAWIAGYGILYYVDGTLIHQQLGSFPSLTSQVEFKVQGPLGDNVRFDDFQLKIMAGELA